MCIDPSREIIVDNFAGGGGASTGIEEATGHSVHIAINHDLDAIAMHTANHPSTEHYCESVFDVDPIQATRGRPVALAWFSPDCKHFSKAKGAKPVSKEIRGLAWVAVRWASLVSPRVIMLENVEEFITWGPLIAARDKKTGRVLKKVITADGDLDYVPAEPGEVVPVELQSMVPDPKRKGRTFVWFVHALRSLGYDVEWRELRACDFGAPTSRKRLFLIARCDGLPIVWPEPTHGSPTSIEVMENKRAPWRTAKDIIDWDIECPSIFERKRELADNTKRRIARGIFKFVLNNPKPFIMRVNHSGSNHHYCDSIEEPLKTITSKNGWGLVTPYIARIGQTGFAGDRLQYPIGDPLTTVTTKTEHLLVAPTLTPISKLEKVSSFMADYLGEEDFQLPIPNTADFNDEDPDKQDILFASHLIKLRGTCKDGQQVTEPMPTITAGGLHVGEVRAFLVKYYGSADNGQHIDHPLHTITTKDRFGLVTIHGIDYRIVDIGMRMLKPHELFAAQGFPSNYIINIDADGKKYPEHAQVARCGNAVPPPFAKALVRANLPEHCVGSGNHLSLERYSDQVDEGQLAFSM
ncbi:DNA cytosine methyltransferase [Paenibacillus sp. UMB7766-LJ446]|uniref:DNA cytosine methyltransferase n=1 Tax=Paenibacillus sp. UMB7766-LJ446 TaxID=3046313 RepID=UPI00254D7333|nr:DNA cytosine methyltransferase [Paenibacillus sp. UMB7766-LJ446]MDK8193213.1 DNA cytosine methyltransferase [Paenibacillus sp. UMB7766-LJ446]